MKKSLLEETAKQESTYWWYVGRLSIVENQLKLVAKALGNKQLKILNVGSGTGGTISTLEQFGSVKNVDVSQDAIFFLKQHGYDADLIDGKALPFEEESFDVVVALDVIEHIENEKSTLKEWRRVLRQGGAILITVPAHQWLWSEFDEVNNHYRRYSKNQLAQVVSKSGFDIKKASYSMVFSFPMIVGFRFISKIIKPKKSADKSNFVQIPPPLNSLFITFLQLEAKMHNVLDFPTGTSVLLRAFKS